MGEKSWDASYNIDVLIGHNWTYTRNVDQPIRDQLTKLFRHLINFNDGHCRSLDTMGGRNGDYLKKSRDWVEYIDKHILAGDGDNDNHDVIMVNFTKIRPCTIRQDKLIYRGAFNVNIWTEGFGRNLWPNIGVQVTISLAKQHSLQSLTMLKVIKSLKTVQEVEDVKQVWRTSFPHLLELMERWSEFVINPALTGSC